MTDSLAVLDRPKFQFNANTVMGLAARNGIVRFGAKDHCINRPVQTNRRAHGMAGLMQIVEGTFIPQYARRYECAIGRKA